MSVCGIVIWKRIDRFRCGFIKTGFHEAETKFQHQKKSMKIYLGCYILIKLLKLIGIIFRKIIKHKNISEEKFGQIMNVDCYC